jgi:hypothetical protein
MRRWCGPGVVSKFRGHAAARPPSYIRDDLAATAQAHSVREVWPVPPDGNLSLTPTKEEDVPLAIAGTGYGVIGILVIILLVVLIFYFVRRA